MMLSRDVLIPRSLSAALAHESVDAGDTLLDRLRRSRIGKADVLAVARDPAPEVNVGEHRDAGLVEQPPAKFFGIAAAGALACPGDIGPRVDRKSTRLALDAGNLIEQAHDQDRKSTRLNSSHMSISYA